MNLITGYDSWHRRIIASGPDHADEGSPWYKLVLEYLGSVKGKNVLEVACGRGGFAKLLATRGAIMYGVDFSGIALQAALRKSTIADSGAVHVDWTQADAQQLPFAERSFEVVVSCETIEHLPDPQLALCEMARVCRPGGLLYLTTPNYFNAMGLYYIYARVRGRRLLTPGSDQPTDHVFTFPKIRAMVKRAGWKIIRSDGTVHQVPIRRGHNPVAVPAIESRRSIRRLLRPLALHYFVMASRTALS